MRGQRGPRQLVAGAAPAGGKQQGQLIATRAGCQHIRGQGCAAGGRKRAQKIPGKSKTRLSRCFFPVAQPQQHKPHAEPVQRRGSVIRPRRIVQMGSHTRGFAFHAFEQRLFPWPDL